MVKKISAKRRARYLACLGYVPQRPLTRDERVKCGLKVKEEQCDTRSCSKSQQRITTAVGMRSKKIRKANIQTDMTRKKKQAERITSSGTIRFPKPKDTPGRRLGVKDKHGRYKVHTRKIRYARKSVRKGSGCFKKLGWGPKQETRFEPDKNRNPNAERAFADPRSRIVGKGNNRRVRLRGEDYEALRRQAFERAGGRCERQTGILTTINRKTGEKKILGHFSCENSAPRASGSDFNYRIHGHLSHLKHGARKSDMLDQVIWSCASCHLAEHGTRWRKQRMENAWKPEEVAEYYHAETACVCFAEKSLDSAMCDDCRQSLRETQPALLHVIENGSGDPLFQGMAEFQNLVRSTRNG